MLKYDWKNPLMIDNVVIEKEEFDSWLDQFRTRESEIDADIRGNIIPYGIPAALDNALFVFEKSSEENFKNIFGATIKVTKIVRNIGGIKHLFPATINLSNNNFLSRG